jgi:hypothetical protein
MVDPVKGLSEIPQMLLPDSSRSKSDLGVANIYEIVTILRKLIRLEC